MSLSGQYYREYVLDEDTGMLIPTFLYGVPKKYRKQALLWLDVYDEMA